MTSQGYGLPASVALFGTIYAIALAVAPTDSSAVQQTEWPHDEQQIDVSHGPVAHTPPGTPGIQSTQSLHSIGARLQLHAGGKTTVF